MALGGNTGGPRCKYPTMKTISKAKPVLPKKLWQLASLALKDLAAVERSPKYEVNMWAWHRPVESRGSKVCHVCLAGAVMAKTLKVSQDEYCSPETSPSYNRALHAIDSLREGFVAHAYAYLYPRRVGKDSVCELNRIVPIYGPYAAGQQRFKKAMRKLIADMKKLDI